MNVLMVDQFGEPGGAQKCLLDLIDGWPDGDTLIVAAPEKGPLLDSARLRGCTTMAIPCGPYTLGAKRFRDVRRFFGDVARQRRVLRRTIEEDRIDVVYANGPRVLPGAALAARGRCPVVYHAHNPLTRGSEAALVRSALKLGGARAIACCRHAAGSMDAEVIHNGVADAGYRERQYPPAGAWRIGIAGRVSEEKGHLILLDAVRLLISEGHRMQVAIAGASLFSPREYANDVWREAAGLDVEFTGWTDDIGAFLRGLDVLAVPSIAEPGLPRVVLEAFSAGVPVVALASGGIAEAVRDGVTGYLASEPTAAALARRIRDVIVSPPAEIVRVARTAREEWELYWNVERWRRDVTGAIRATAKTRGGARCDAPDVSTTTSADQSSELA